MGKKWGKGERQREEIERKNGHYHQWIRKCFRHLCNREEFDAGCLLNKPAQLSEGHGFTGMASTVMVTGAHGEQALRLEVQDTGEDHDEYNKWTRRPAPS